QSNPLSLHDALPIYTGRIEVFKPKAGQWYFVMIARDPVAVVATYKLTITLVPSRVTITSHPASTEVEAGEKARGDEGDRQFICRSEEHTSELQSRGQ